ncbi:hypothetical protein Tco_0059843 [Tanacetum coccineum]
MKILNIIRSSIDKQFGYRYVSTLCSKETLHLIGDEQVDLVTTLRLFIRRIVLKKRVEDVQLGFESYQTQLNITIPQS